MGLQYKNKFKNIYKVGSWYLWGGGLFLDFTAPTPRILKQSDNGLRKLGPSKDFWTGLEVPSGRS